MIGQVGDRPAAVGGPESEGAPALVRDLRRQYREPLDRVLARFDRPEPPSGAKLTGPDREVRRREGPRQHGLGGVGLAGYQHPDPMPGPRTGGEERHAMSVIPVQMTQEQRAAERHRPERRVQIDQSGARVQDQFGRRAVPGQTDARGVAAVADEGSPGRRRRPAGAAEVDIHPGLRPAVPDARRARRPLVTFGHCIANQPSLGGHRRGGSRCRKPGSPSARGRSVGGR